MKNLNKIKIMHIAQAAGGVDRYIRMLMKYLGSEKYENILVCSTQFKKGDYTDLVTSFEYVDMNRNINFNDMKAVGKIRSLIKEYKPDIVYAHSSKAGGVARIADIGLDNYCIYNPHGWAFNMDCSAEKRMAYILIEKTAALFCDKIVCISNAERADALKRKICREEKLRVIFNGVDIGEYDNRSLVIGREKLNIPKEAFVVGALGRISRQKAPDVFVRAAVQIKKEIPNAFFLMVGGGTEEQDIVNYAVNNGLGDSFLITGWVENPLSYVDNFDVALCLSRWEGFGLAISECMLAQKPVVATRVDAIPDIIRDRDNGLLVEPDNVDEVRNAVMELYHDRNLYESLARRGEEDARKRFDVKRVAEEHQRLFDEMLAGKKND